MREQNNSIAAGLRCKKRIVCNRPFVKQLLWNELVFQHRETVPVGQRVRIDRIEGNVQLPVFFHHSFISSFSTIAKMASACPLSMPTAPVNLLKAGKMQWSDAK